MVNTLIETIDLRPRRVTDTWLCDLFQRMPPQTACDPIVVLTAVEACPKWSEDIPRLLRRRAASIEEYRDLLVSVAQIVAAQPEAEEELLFRFLPRIDDDDWADRGFALRMAQVACLDGVENNTKLFRHVLDGDRDIIEAMVRKSETRLLHILRVMPQQLKLDPNFMHRCIRANWACILGTPAETVQAMTTGQLYSIIPEERRGILRTFVIGMRRRGFPVELVRKIEKERLIDEVYESC